MNSKTVLLLNSSILVKKDLFRRRNISIQWGKQRIDQHILGYKELNRFKIFELFENVIFTDNTIRSENKIPREIKKMLPKDAIIRIRNKNDVGVLNKGAGLIENLVFCSEQIKQFEYIVYYEPRLLLTDPSFFEDVVEQTQNTFFSQKGYELYRTGHFIAKTTDLLNFISSQDTDYLIKNKITIEYEFYNFFKPLNPKEVEYSICKRNTGYKFKLDINDNNSYEDY
tara:strand:- start:137 stop:814 length:678 start_codon:yes stop_codon:yes gene_type:complete